MEQQAPGCGSSTEEEQEEGKEGGRKGGARGPSTGSTQQDQLWEIPNADPAGYFLPPKWVPVTKYRLNELEKKERELDQAHADPRKVTVAYLRKKLAGLSRTNTFPPECVSGRRVHCRYAR